MSISLPWYEVRVKVRQGNNSRYKVRTHHIEARNPDNAEERARRYGEPMSVRKIQIDTSSIENLMFQIKDTQPKQVSQAIAMDEMIWARRNKRRENMYKDKLDK